MAYFTRTSALSFAATQHVSGAWDTAEQHIAPALGLMLHVVEADRDSRRGDGLVPARLSYDILGTIPVEEVTVQVEVLRAGRSIELVQARLSHAGRDAVLLRAWLMQTSDTGMLQGTSLPTIEGPDVMPGWEPSEVWPGGFIASAEVRRRQVAPGRAAFWVRTAVPLVEGEPVSRLASMVGLLDIANGMTVRADPAQLAFPNLDLTAHLFRRPQGEWLGFDTSVSFGPTGLGLTNSVLHDVDGPWGVSAQVLTLRPR